MQNKAENTSLFYEDNNGGLYKKIKTECMET